MLVRVGGADVSSHDLCRASRDGRLAGARVWRCLPVCWICSEAGASTNRPRCCSSRSTRSISDVVQRIGPYDDLQPPFSPVVLIERVRRLLRDSTPVPRPGTQNGSPIIGNGAEAAPRGEPCVQLVMLVR